MHRPFHPSRHPTPNTMQNIHPSGPNIINFAGFVDIIAQHAALSGVAAVNVVSEPEWARELFIYQISRRPPMSKNTEATRDSLSETPEAISMSIEHPETAASPKPTWNSLGSFTMKVLNGISIAVVVALVPQALLGELLKALVPHWPALKTLLTLVALSSSMLPILIGVLVAMQFKLTPIQTASVGIAAVLGSGVATVDPNGGFHLQGTGLVINTGLTAALAVGVVLLIGPKLGNYTILLLSTIVIVIAGGIGWVITYPAVNAFSVWLGSVINGATGLQPIVMGAILAVAFALGIVSPISTVGIATAIYMSGVASGTANLGVVAAGFGLAIAGWKANGLATSLLPILGSPKVHMANIWGRPLNFLPLGLSAAVLGAAGGALGISGTPISAGFGISGLVGPLAALNAEGWGWSAANILIILAIFVVAPIILTFASFWVCEKAGLVASENYKLNFE